MDRKTFLVFLLFFFGSGIVSGGSYKVKKIHLELFREKSTLRQTELLIDLANEIKGSNPDSALFYFSQAENVCLTLDNRGKKEENFIKILIGRASVEIAKGNLDKAKVLDSSALIKAKKINNRQLQAAILMSQGSIFYNQSRFKEAQKYNEAALHLIKTTADRKTEGKIITNMGTIEFLLGNTQIADSLFRIPLKLAEASKDDDLLAASLLNIGLLSYYKGDYKKAEDFIQKSAGVYKEIDGRDGLALCYENLSNIWFGQGNIEKTIEYSILHQDISVSLGDKSSLGKAYQNLGECYAQIGDYEKALDYYIKGLKIKTCLGDIKEIAITNSSIGHIHYLEGDLQEALLYYRKSLTDFEKIGYTLGIASAYCDIGNMFADQNNLDSALIYFLKAENLYINLQNVSSLADVYLSTGKAYQSMKNFAKAERYFQQAEVSKIQLGDKLGMFNVQACFAEMYYHRSFLFLRTSSSVKSILNKALKYALDAKALADSLHHLPGQYETAGYLMDIYTELGNPSEALRFARLKLSLSDSLNRKQRAEALINAEIRWKSEHKQTVIEQLHEEKNLQLKVIEQQSALNNRLYLIIAAILVMMLLMTGISYLYIRNRAKQKDIEFQRHVNDITRLKMENIHNRLSPHLFFNMLGSLSEDITNPEKMRRQIANAAVLLRKSLENAEHTSIPLSEELEMVKAYIELVRSKIPPPFSFDLHLIGKVGMDTKIPSMIIQIPVENAIKHGLMPCEGKKELMVSVGVGNGSIDILIEDNGIGRERSKSRTTGTGTGLKVLLQTISLLNHRNKEHIAIHIKDKEPQGTVVQISIPPNFSFNLQN